MLVGSGVLVAVGGGVFVAVGIGVDVSVNVAVGSGEPVNVAVGIAVWVGVGVFVAVAVGSEVFVRVAVGGGEPVKVAVGTTVFVAVGIAVAVGGGTVNVAVGIGVGTVCVAVGGGRVAVGEGGTVSVGVGAGGPRVAWMLIAAVAVFTAMELSCCGLRPVMLPGKARRARTVAWMVAGEKLQRLSPAETRAKIMRTTASLTKSMSTGSTVLKTKARVSVPASGGVPSLPSPTDTMKRHVVASVPCGKSIW